MKNESRGLDRLFQRLLPVLDASGLTYEVIAVDDGSTDDTLARLKAFRQQAPALKIVSLSRNFGKEIGVTAGMRRTSGEVVVLMDSDLQHPPESIPDLLKPWREEGYAVVYARRTGLDRGGFVRTALSKAFYKVFDFMSDVKIDREAGDFMAMDRKVVDAFISMRERNRFNRGLLTWAGFRSHTISVPMEDRVDGSSRFGFLKLIGLAVNAITAFGTLPLRVWSYIGGIVSALALLYGIYIVFKTILFGADVPGFPSTIAAIMFSSGVQLIGLGIIGEYIGRVFSEVKGRPLYFEQEAVGFDEKPAFPPAQAPSGTP
jgi:glycosyltransferase involved in cell wall biosynthesis